MTISEENYLKAIYQLQQQKVKGVGTKDISVYLCISPPSVTEMLKRLSKKNYVYYEPYKEILLTKLGEKESLKIIRKHRIIELYLKEKLDFSWNEVHKEAEQLEHAASDQLIEKMEKSLGYPEFDPHGSPIPNKKGKMSFLKNALVLTECKKAGWYKVVRIKSKNEVIMSFLNKINLNLNINIKLKEIREVDQSFIVEIKGSEELLTEKITKQIWVVPIN